MDSFSTLHIGMDWVFLLSIFSMVWCLSKVQTVSITIFRLSLSSQSILKKNVTMQHTPSAVYHYSDAGGGDVHHNKVNAIFQAAKKDLLQVIQIQVVYKLHLLVHLICL